MIKLICRVTLLDHHKTAFEEMESRVKTPDNLEINLDMHLSGATIALQYFKPKVAQIYCQGQSCKSGAIHYLAVLNDIMHYFVEACTFATGQEL